MSKKTTSPKNRKRLHDPIFLAIISVLSAMVLWIIFTVIIPLTRGNSITKYQGLQKDMATTIVDLVKLYNGPQSPSWVPDDAYIVNVEDIHPTTKEEIAQYCASSHPSYISNNSKEPRYYTIDIAERYLFTASIKKTKYVGCNPIDYIHVQVFGIPKEVDTRYHIEWPQQPSKQ